MGMRKALSEPQELDLIFQAYDQTKKGEKTIEEVCEDFGIARPSFYRYRSQKAKRLEKIGQNLDVLLENSNTPEAFRNNYYNLIAESKKQEEEQITKAESMTVQKIQHEIKKDIPGELISKLNQRVKPLELEPEKSIEEPKEEPKDEGLPQKNSPNKILLYGGLTLVAIIVLLTLKRTNTNKAESLPTTEKPANYRPANYVTAIEF
jgi:hypothetical protein